MKRALRERVMAVVALAGALGCGPAPEVPQPSGPAMSGVAEAAQAPEGGRAPVIARVRIEPEAPVPGGRVRALVDVSDPDGGAIRLQYAWTLAGAAIGADAPDLSLEQARKGQELEVVVIGSDGTAQSAPGRAHVILGNRAPRLSAVTLEPTSGLRIGGRVKAVPESSDPDDDVLRYEVTWLVDGNPVAGEGLELDTKRLRRGDRIRAQVRATDGLVTTEPITSHEVQIENSAPQIVSRPQTQFEGDVFQYVVEAKDPDGDRSLRFSLDRAPEGMTIDRFDGAIRWAPAPAQTGAHAVEVAVEDGQGGKSVQGFEVTIGRDPAASAPPAAPAER